MPTTYAPYERRNICRNERLCYDLNTGIQEILRNKCIKQKRGYNSTLLFYFSAFLGASFIICFFIGAEIHLQINAINIGKKIPAVRYTIAYSF